MSQNKKKTFRNIFFITVTSVVDNKCEFVEAKINGFMR